MSQIQWKGLLSSPFKQGKSIGCTLRPNEQTDIYKHYYPAEVVRVRRIDVAIFFPELQVTYLPSHNVGATSESQRTDRAQTVTHPSQLKHIARARALWCMLST